MKYTASYKPIGDGFLCSVRGFEDVISTGKTLDEARENLRGALRDMLDYYHDKGLPLTPPVGIETVASEWPGEILEEIEAESAIPSSFFEPLPDDFLDSFDPSKENT